MVSPAIEIMLNFWHTPLVKLKKRLPRNPKNPLRGPRSLSMLHIQPVRLRYAHGLGLKKERLLPRKPDVGAVEICEDWVETPLGDDWVVAVRILPQDGQPVVGELRVFPSEPGRPVYGGRWSAEVLGDKAKVPRGGLTARLLREVRIGESLRFFTSGFRDRHKSWLELIGIWPQGRRGYTLPSTRNVSRLGRRGKPDIFYANIAKDYVKRVIAGSRSPVKEMAKARRFPPENMRDMVHEARRRGLLTSGKQGKLGGGLTDEVRAILAPTRKIKKRAFLQFPSTSI